MATSKTGRFTVAGRGPFPVDMLRHDCAWPREGSDAAKLLTDEPREIVLLSDRLLHPTTGRWASFGWTVIREEIV
ncbi:MAG: hypothetical protein JWR85_4224 [Marmoricola sp.]|nr:hypothetical protein [Marmoricola sp.]